MDRRSMGTCYALATLLALTGSPAAAWRNYGTPGTANEITVIKNQTGKLYCNVTLPTGGGVGDENPTQIRWYKGAELIYMLTSEGRNVPIRQMTHRPSASWRDRLQVRTTRLPIWLSIDPVMLHDQGYYQCLVYYGTDVKRNVSHFLRVIEPPENVVIIFGTRPREIRLSANQKVRQNEGEDLYLECHVIGGKPEPRIRWLESDRKGSMSYGNERVLKVPRVPRRLDNTSYTCEASNNNITEPLRTSVTVLLNLKPVNVSIRNKDTPLKAGVLARVECESYGSRPAPQFSWWLDGKELVNNSRSVENDLSVLYFEPTVQNNGQKLTCISRNPLIRDSDCVDIWTLDVHFKPQITLLFKGVRVQFANITRGATVSLECRTSGNPRTGNITWLLNKQRLPRKSSPKKGVFFRDSTVVDIVNANRNHSGSYSCSGFNAVGSTTSNEVYLRVLYEPECMDVVDSYLTAALDETVRVPCRVAADPPHVSYSWSFRSSLDEMATRNLTTPRNGSGGLFFYQPKVAADFGTVYCWAQNDIGPMAKPCIFHVVLKESEDTMTSYVLLAVIITFLFVLILVPVVVVIVVQTRERDVRKKGQNSSLPVVTPKDHTLPKSMYGDHSV
ncbi:B-cell receptor CD22-like [Dermacentor variabilis]|uniref:B-cell receptor CD22-like n=1 Tax=Dermacentor variabilis TaxID=34621 RepID=UPI003F5B9819